MSRCVCANLRLFPPFLSVRTRSTEITLFSEELETLADTFPRSTASADAGVPARDPCALVCTRVSPCPCGAIRVPSPENVGGRTAVCRVQTPRPRLSSGRAAWLHTWGPCGQVSQCDAESPLSRRAGGAAWTKREACPVGRHVSTASSVPLKDTAMHPIFSWAVSGQGVFTTFTFNFMCRSLPDTLYHLFSSSL